MISHIPAFGICGWSGSGKTTVIEPLIEQLTSDGLKVCVLKNDGHGLDIDRDGKDSDRFFKAGADVMMRGPEQGFLRTHRVKDSELWDQLKMIAPRYDLVLVEGHKSTPLSQKIWLLKDDGEECPPEAGDVTRILKREDDRLGIITEMLSPWYRQTWLSTPVTAGILIGGKSSRMGRPKHLIEGEDGRTWLESAVDVVRPFVDRVVVLGSGEVPSSLADLAVLPDVEGMRGPIAGMLSAMRWNPLGAWIFAACDMPRIAPGAIQWLLDQRAPGTWAVMPRLPESPGAEPLLAYYDFRAHHLLENSSRPIDMQHSQKVITPEPPAELVGSWQNINTPSDLQAG